MMSLRKLPALAMLALYMQAALVLSVVSVIVTDDGSVQIESSAAHLVHWHGSKPQSGSEHGCIHSHGDPSHSTTGHTHQKVTDPSVGADNERAKAQAETPPLAPRIDGMRSVGLLRTSKAAGPRLSAPPPDLQFSAAKAAFTRIVLLV